MTEGARHADSVGAHQVFAVVIGWVRVVFFGAPCLRGSFVKGGIWEQAQAEDARGLAVKRTHWLCAAVTQSLATRADHHVRVLALVLKRVSRAALGPHIQSQAAVTFVAARRIFRSKAH